MIIITRDPCLLILYIFLIWYFVSVLYKDVYKKIWLIPYPGTSLPGIITKEIRFLHIYYIIYEEKNGLTKSGWEFMPIFYSREIRDKNNELDKET